ncbi:Cwf15/Cwc15 cell cycle control protein [Hesseltinella vesiculosa]|uniref:Cwf15/Cwc15 cell cycle control protein n=1 Tax=Hesseltinella vesiculosa TaxID=101127 RepID=A0A1X2GRF5_9FUNG|nr:Cwf15/Cwc15 cell cycle control protein [Hesseltinella vesiculosa]
MTTAARPTFDPARGKDNNAPSFIYSARDLASHTKLKFRQPGQGTASEIGDRERLKEELRLAEEEYYQSKNKQAASDRLLTGADGDEGGTIDEIQQRAMAEAEKLAALDKEDSDDEDDSSDEDESDEEDDDDDTEELMATLARIRQERAEERERQELERQQEQEDQRQQESMTGNPLLNIGEQKSDFQVKRRWDDDVIFKNQARGDDERPNKRFVNDMLRSDFHRRFLHKYVQ